MSKKKIMLFSDDLRMSSGIGTMSKEFAEKNGYHDAMMLDFRNMPSF